MIKINIRHIRRLLSFLKRTPLHPQWLLGPQRAPQNIDTVQGVVLDIGSADRWLEKKLPLKTRYIALDYPATGADLYHGSPDVFADGAQLPFADNSFDAVFCLEVLEHVERPTLVMREISRVLKSQGTAYISMPFLYPLHDAPYDFQRFTEFGLKREAELAGLHIEHITKTGHAIKTGGLILCLAIAGGLLERPKILMPFYAIVAVPLIVIVNTTTWLLSSFWPSWKHINTGHSLRLKKNG